MIAIDTNILVYAHRPHLEAHARCRAAIEDLVRSGTRFALPWPCLHEFISVVTNARVFSPPTSATEAVAFLNDFAALSNCQFVGETTRHLGILGELMETPGVTGPRVHDARIAAICLSHGVSELWTADRDFSYFPRLRTRNPVVA
jgi:toxin-antitoxin system PIN domain toxin